MASKPQSGKHFDLVILLFLFALLVFVSPMKSWWTDSGSAWYTPYLLWFVVVVLAFWLQRRMQRP